MHKKPLVACGERFDFLKFHVNSVNSVKCSLKTIRLEVWRGNSLAFTGESQPVSLTAWAPRFGKPEPHRDSPSSLTEHRVQMCICANSSQLPAGSHSRLEGPVYSGTLAAIRRASVETASPYIDRKRFESPEEARQTGVRSTMSACVRRRANFSGSSNSLHSEVFDLACSKSLNWKQNRESRGGEQ